MTISRHMIEHAILGVEGSVADLHAHVAHHVALGNRAAADIGAHLIAHAVLGVVVGAAPSAEAYWIATLGGAGSDDCFGVAPTPDGRIVICGSTDSQGAGGTDAFIAKYTGAGAVEWQRGLGGTGAEQGKSVAIDADGNIYVAGHTASQGAGGFDALIAKYNSAGTLQWQRSLGGAGSDSASAIALDSAGNIYVAGHTASQGAGSNDALIAKYNSAGTLQWQRILGGAAIEQIDNLAIDSSGNIYAVGLTASQGAGSNDALIAKYNSAGTLQWQRSLGGSADDRATGVVVNTDGYIYVGGRTASQGAGSSDILLAKYNSAGAIQWQRSLGGASNDIGLSLAADADGNLYILGVSNVSTVFGYVIAKYNSAGTLQWQRTLNAAVEAWPRSIAVDASGALLVSGYVKSGGSGDNEALLARLPSDGSLTGTYGAFTYAAATFTDAARTLTDSALTLTDAAATLTDAATTLTDAAATLTGSLVTVG